MSYLRFLRNEPGASLRGRVRTASRNPEAGISLGKRRRWYADEDEETTEEDETQPGADDTDDSGDADEDANETDIPQEVEDLPEWAQKLLKDNRTEAAKYRTKLREIEEERKAKAIKDAEEQGNFKKLWEESEADRKELEQLRQARTARLETLKTRNEKRITDLPKDKQAVAREIIDTAGADDPDKVSALLDKIIPTLGVTPNAPDLNGGAKGNSRKGSGAAKVKLNKAGF